jgi:hypothetical protein
MLETAEQLPRTLKTQFKQATLQARSERLLQPGRVRTTLAGATDEGRCLKKVATESGGGNMEIEKTDFHIPAATTTTTR